MPPKTQTKRPPPKRVPPVKSTPITTAPINQPIKPILKPVINKPILNSRTRPMPKRVPPVKSTPIITKPIVSGPTSIIPPKLPNTEPIVQYKPIITPTTTAPYSNSPNITSSNLPNTTPETATNQDNTLTYAILGAIVVGFIILKNKDI